MSGQILQIEEKISRMESVDSGRNKKENEKTAFIQLSRKREKKGLIFNEKRSLHHQKLKVYPNYQNGNNWISRKGL